MNNLDFWSEQITSWLNMGHAAPKRMICVIDDDDEYDTICDLMEDQDEYSPISYLIRNKIPVHDVSEQWYLYPDKPVIIVGSAPMLLSRALNRGYGMSADLWPIVFGLLHNDSIWCMKHGNKTCDALQQSRKRLGTHNSFQYVHNHKPTLQKNIDVQIQRFFDTSNGRHTDVEYLTGEKFPPAERLKVRKQTRKKLWVSLADHSSHTVINMQNICKNIQLGRHTKDLLHAARHHDWAKSHPVFQNALLVELSDSERALRGGTMWAKRRPRINMNVHGFSHDLVGGAAMMCDENHSDLSRYLVMAHHGRYRTGIQDIKDSLPVTDLGGKIIKDKIDIDLSAQKYGSMVAKLYKNHGPYILAYLEALLRVADIRSSIQLQ